MGETAHTQHHPSIASSCDELAIDRERQFQPEGHDVMAIKVIGTGLFALLAALPITALPQTITSGLPTVAQVPVDNPIGLGILLLGIALAGWWSLGRSKAAVRGLSLLLVAVAVGWGGLGAGLVAQVVNAFTNPAGQTLPITVSPITAGGFTGFQPADFTNNSGTVLRIAAIDTPDLGECFATNAANTLLPQGALIASPHPSCGVGTALANGATCRVDVETICRGLYVSGATLTSISPGSGTASGGAGVTLTGTGLTGATSVTFDGVAATSVNVINSTTITAVTPAHAAGAVNVVVITPGGAAQLVSGYTYLATAVGQSSGGGVIAALDGGLNDLIASTADNSSGIAWGGLGTAVGAGAQSANDGDTNTSTITTALGGGSYAAQLCSSYQIDSQGNTPCQVGNTCYSNWFLPASNQLAALFANRIAVGGFSSASYWSSTEASVSPTNAASITSFASGAQVVDSKSNLRNVRCVRSFTP
jgi:hypothetical protein